MSISYSWLLCEWLAQEDKWSAWREVDQLEFVMTFSRHGGQATDINNAIQTSSVHPDHSTSSEITFDLATFRGIFRNRVAS